MFKLGIIRLNPKNTRPTRTESESDELLGTTQGIHKYILLCNIFALESNFKFRLKINGRNNACEIQCSAITTKHKCTIFILS